MKYNRLFLIAPLFLFLSCKNDSTTGPVIEGALIGIWSVEDESGEWLLTTNSNQTAFTPFDSDGQVTVSGAVNTSLKSLIFNISENGDILISKLENVDGVLKYIYTLYKPAAGNDARFIIQETQQRFNGTLDYTYDDDTLTVNQSTFMDAATNETVTVSGTLSVIKTDIPANVPTAVSFPDIFIDSGGIINVKTYEFKSDGTFGIIVLGANSSVASGTYTADGNQITLVYQSDNTVTFDYSISGNSLTLINSDLLDFCEVLGIINNQTECLQRAEQVFNLTASSLTAMTTRGEINLTKAGS